MDPGGIRAGLARFEVQSLSEKTGGIGSVRKTISVLLAEDNPADAGLVQETLEEQRIKGDLTVIADGETAIMSIDYLDAEPVDSPDLAIIPKRTSFRSPWQNGVAERWVRERPPGPAGSRYRFE